MDSKINNENSELYNCRDISKILKVNERYARNVMRQPQFPSFKIGAKVFVRVKDFNEWYESLAGKEIPIDPNVNKFKK